MHQKILAALGWRNFGWTLRRASLKPQPLCIVFEAAGQRGSKHNTSGAFLCHRVQVAKLVGTCRCKCAVTVCTSYLLVPNVHREIFKGTVSDCVLATLVKCMSVTSTPARVAGLLHASPSGCPACQACQACQPLHALLKITACRVSV